MKNNGKNVKIMEQKWKTTSRPGGVGCGGRSISGWENLLGGGTRFGLVLAHLNAFDAHVNGHHGSRPYRGSKCDATSNSIGYARNHEFEFLGLFNDDYRIKKVLLASNTRS